ncbi:MAG: hypothetical protein JXR18_11395 [Neptuniibacter sp.]
MEDGISRDPLSAWKELLALGGIEPEGRDEDFSAHLTQELDPNASSVEEALSKSSMEQFLSAFFQASQPFAAIFLDILEFFEQSKVHKGQNQWRLSVGDAFIDKAHFAEFRAYWESIEYQFEVPALERGDAFFIYEACKKLKRKDYGLITKTAFNTDVESWLKSYDDGEYLLLPSSLKELRIGEGIETAITVLDAALSILFDQGVTRSQMFDEYRKRGNKSVSNDAFHPWTIAQNETDFWLRGSISYLDTLSMCSDEEKKAFDSELQGIFADFSPRKLKGKIDIQALERLLSFPVWKKRYELYGVWIATEVLRAIPEHQYSIHDQAGELQFGYSEAMIATIHSSRLPLHLISEKRSPVSNPRGKSRKNNVKPDLVLWGDVKDQKGCRMVIEVKHYKKRSARNFKDALDDYSRAHPGAKHVLLVNYGPVGQQFTGISNRCNMLGYLNPQNQESRDTFAKYVRDVVGEEYLKTSNQCLVIDIPLLFVDISQSMNEILFSKWFRQFVENYKKWNIVKPVVDRVIDLNPHDNIYDWLSRNPYRTSNELKGPMEGVVNSYGKNEFLLLTDNEGFKRINGLAANIERIDVDDPSEPILLVLSKRDLNG